MSRKALIASVVGGVILLTPMAYWCANHSNTQKTVWNHEECENDSLTISRIIHDFGFMNVPANEIAKFSLDNGVLRAKELAISKRDLLQKYEFNIDSAKPLKQFSGIGCLDGLEIVRISGFREIHAIPIEIGKLLRLRHFAVIETSIDGLPNSIWEIKNIESIYLPYNKIRKLPDDVCKLSDLNKLHLAGNPLIKFPDCMASHEGMQHIIIDQKDVWLVPSRLRPIVSSP